MRVVLDVNVLISAILSPGGSAARLLRAWEAGAFELIASPALLAELERALGYPKIRRLVPEADAAAYAAWLAESATMAMDPHVPPPVHAADPDDDFLLALAAAQRAILVSGDAHLLALTPSFPVRSPAQFLATLDEA
ncbi:MAG TPA: putative toxin-antitoxin system toxin component, PIN family [Candidatus Limnocylindrales bacterium]|nr:putative toxin-antitoxin system toxin component, PIN family [Candidatus Limnocylindrales bacterium]